MGYTSGEFDPSREVNEQFSAVQCFNYEFLEENMESCKEYFEEVKKEYAESVEKGYKYGFQNRGGRQFYFEQSRIFSNWYIFEDMSGFNVIYSFNNNDATTKILDVFQTAKDNGIIKQNFGANFPSLVVYDKERNMFRLTFSTNSKLLQWQTTEGYLNDRLNFLKNHQEALYKKVQIFQQFENEKCPFFKKKKFNAGKQIMTNLKALAPIIIDNTNQAKINSYSEIAEIAK